MAKEFGRAARVSAQLQKELAWVIQHELSDPRLGLITVNEVELTKDMGVAKVYITVLNADDQGKLKNVNLLNQLAPYIRSGVARRMCMRHISKLRFHYDDSFDRGMRVAELLSDVEINKD